MADEVKLLVEAAESFLGAFHDHRGRCAHCDIDADALRAAIEAWNTRAPSTLPDGWRERVAELIDPNAFRMAGLGVVRMDPEKRIARRQVALSKADAIGEVFGGLGSVATAARQGGEDG